MRAFASKYNACIVSTEPAAAADWCCCCRHRLLPCPCWLLAMTCSCPFSLWQHMAEEDFFAGRWAPYLDRALQLKRSGSIRRGKELGRPVLSLPAPAPRPPPAPCLCSTAHIPPPAALRYDGPVGAESVVETLVKVAQHGGDLSAAGLDLAPGRVALMADRVLWSHLFGPGGRFEGMQGEKRWGRREGWEITTRCLGFKPRQCQLGRSDE